VTRSARLYAALALAVALVVIGNTTARADPPKDGDEIPQQPPTDDRLYGEASAGMGLDSYVGQVDNQHRAVGSFQGYGEFRPSPSWHLSGGASALVSSTALAQGVVDGRAVYSGRVGAQTVFTLGTAVGLERNRTLFADGLIQSGAIARDSSRLAIRAEVSRRLGRLALRGGTAAVVKDVVTNESYSLAAGGVVAGARYRVRDDLHVDLDLGVDARRVAGLLRRDVAGEVLSMQAPTQLTTATAALSAHFLSARGIAVHAALSNRHQWERDGVFLDGRLTSMRVGIDYAPAPFLNVAGDLLWQGRHYGRRAPGTQNTKAENNLASSVRVVLWWAPHWGNYAAYNLDHFNDDTLAASESRHVLTTGIVVRRAD